MVILFVTNAYATDQNRTKTVATKQQELKKDINKTYIDDIMPFTKVQHDPTMIFPFVDLDMSFESYIDGDDLAPIEKFR
jgi:hypothetical protein